jgi:hypothetical protein
MDKAVAILFLLWSTLAFGQFDPAGGEEGSFGIPSNSPFIVSWGDSIQVERGLAGCLGHHSWKSKSRISF